MNFGENMPFYTFAMPKKKITKIFELKVKQNKFFSSKMNNIAKNNKFGHFWDFEMLFLDILIEFYEIWPKSKSRIDWVENNFFLI